MRVSKTAQIIALIGLTSLVAQAATLEATYLFQNNLNAEQGGVPALTAVDPLNAATFETATVDGQSRTVYRWGGQNSPPANQGGLTFDNSGALLTTNSYSVEMVFQFDGTAGWRRILDVQNRTSDAGFYVDPSNNLDVFPVAGSSGLFTTGFHHVVLTTASDGTVAAYLDGTPEFSTNTTVMNINNPQDVVNLFLDNTAGGGQGEWSAGDIALARFYDGALTSDQVAALAANPFEGSSPSGVPEPSTIALMFAGLSACAVRVIHRKKTAC